MARREPIPATHPSTSETTMPEKRFFPISCRSAYCGETTCPATCSNLPELTAFNAWKRRTGATQLDPIWSPTCWQAAA